MLVTGGERKAAALLCLALQDLGIPADSFTGAQAGIITDASHMEAEIVEIEPDRIRQTLEAGRLPVVGGAQGISIHGDVTFLGRGGTDTTAVALAAALGAAECEIYTDVEGIFSGDPRLMPTARLLPKISFDEMLAMCGAGCPKPAERAVEYAREHHVPLRVRSAFGSGPGTCIEETSGDASRTVSAVVVDPERGKVSIVGHGVGTRSGPEDRMAEILTGAGIEFEMLTPAPLRRSCLVHPNRAQDAAIALHRAFGLDAQRQRVAGDVPSRWGVARRGRELRPAEGSAGGN